MEMQLLPQLSSPSQGPPYALYLASGKPQKMEAALDPNSLLKCGFSKLIQEGLERSTPSITRSSQSSHLSSTLAKDKTEERQRQTGLQLLLGASRTRVFGRVEPLDH